MSLTKSIYQELELETLVDPNRLRNSTALKLAVARKIDACSSYAAGDIQDVVDWLCTRRWEESRSIEDLIVEWDNQQA